MVVLHIVTHSETQALEIADLLVTERLLISAVIFESVKELKRDATNNIHLTANTMLIGKTKSLLFETIDELLRSKYPDNMPTLYASAIVHMDWEQSKELVENTLKV